MDYNELLEFSINHLKLLINKAFTNHEIELNLNYIFISFIYRV